MVSVLHVLQKTPLPGVSSSIPIILLTQSSQNARVNQNAEIRQHVLDIAKEKYWVELRNDF